MKINVQILLVVLGILFFHPTAKMIYSKDEISGTVTFTMTAAPSTIDAEDFANVTFCKVAFANKDLGCVKVELNLAGTTSLTIQVPDCMARRFFPGEASDIFMWILNYKL